MKRIGIRMLRPSASMVVSVCALIVASTGLGFAAIPNSAGEIHGCYTTRTGALRIIDTQAGESCTSKETAISWNQRGPQGPQGLPGPQGPEGLAGRDGEQGPAGEAGEDGNLALSGQDCPVGKFLTGFDEAGDLICSELEAVLDEDNDGVSDAEDNCAQSANSEQDDSDEDGLGDSCDTYPLNPHLPSLVCPSSPGSGFFIFREPATGVCRFAADLDGDGYTPDDSQTTLGAPGPDCDDNNIMINPDATESTNGVDDDCDGEVDESS